MGSRPTRGSCPLVQVGHLRRVPLLPLASKSRWHLLLCGTPPLDSDTAIYVYIDLVLPMGWVSSLDLFYATSETITDMANVYLQDPTSPYWIYQPTRGTYATTPLPTASPARLQLADVYMDDIIALTQGVRINRQEYRSSSFVSSRRPTPPSLTSRRILLALRRHWWGDGDWTRTK